MGEVIKFKSGRTIYPGDEVEEMVRELVDEHGQSSPRMQALIREHCEPIVRLLAELAEASPAGVELDLPGGIDKAAAADVAQQVERYIKAAHVEALTKMYLQAVSAKVSFCFELWRGRG